MIDDCAFCGSDQIMEEFPGVYRCCSCWRIEVRDAAYTEEKWLEDDYCFEHDFVDTGTKISWCARCNIDATFVFREGKYISNEDIRLLQRRTKKISDGDT